VPHALTSRDPRSTAFEYTVLAAPEARRHILVILSHLPDKWGNELCFVEEGTLYT
jgi:hypothetical protein